jgi:ribosomal protein S18 acetylase RimI-like enzyme
MPDRIQLPSVLDVDALELLLTETEGTWTAPGGEELDMWFYATNTDWDKLQGDMAWWEYYPSNQGMAPTPHFALVYKGDVVAVVFDNGHDDMSAEDHPQRAYSFAVGVAPEWEGKGLERYMVDAIMDIQLDMRRQLEDTDKMIVEVVERDQPAMIEALKAHNFGLIGIDRQFDYSPILIFEHPAPARVEKPFLLSTHDLTPGGQSRLLPGSLPVTFEP